MKRGIIVLLILSLLIFSLGCERFQVLSSQGKSSQFEKLISVLHIKGSSGVSLPGDVPLVFPDMPGSSADLYIGNFFLQADIEGAMQEIGITDENGIYQEVETYKLDKLTITMSPKVLYADVITNNDVSAAWAGGGITRTKLIDINFIKYTIEGDATSYTKTINADTTTNSQLTKKITFKDMYVPKNFKITMRFDAGEEGRGTLKTPALIGAHTPYPVTWQPFPNAKGEDPTIGNYKGKIAGYIKDSFTGEPVRFNYVGANWNPGGARTAKTNHNGYFEFIVDLEADYDGTISPQHYSLNYEGCNGGMQKSFCEVLDTGAFTNVKERFKKRHGVTDYDYAGGANYPINDENYLYVEGSNGNIYGGNFYLSDSVGSRERKQHDFFLQPAIPAAYLKFVKWNTVNWIVNEVETNEIVRIGGLSISTYGKNDKWILKFGDGKETKGTGDMTWQAHNYSKPGLYDVSIKFGNRYDMWSPWYTKKLKVKGVLDETTNATPSQEPIDDMTEYYNIFPYINKPKRVEGGGELEIVQDTEVEFVGMASPLRILNFSWDFNGDGINDYFTEYAGENVKYTYDTPGTYIAKFIVEDENKNKEEVLFTIKVLNIYATFDIHPSNVIKDGTVIDAWYTLHNKYTKPVMVTSNVLAWWHKKGSGFELSHFERTPRYTGIVRPGESKEMWRERETVCCPGTRKGVATMETNFGTVETSLTKTITPGPQNQTPAPVMGISTPKSSYDTIEPITVNLVSNFLNTPCDLVYSINNAPAVIAGTVTTNNNGAASFTRANNIPGVYKAKAVCNNIESNEIIIKVSAPAPLYTVNCFSSKDTYDYDKLIVGEDHIQFKINSNMPNAICDFYAGNIAQGDWSKKDIIPLQQDGTRHVMLPSRATGYFILGVWEAQFICNLPNVAGIKSNKVQYQITRKTPTRQLPKMPDVKVPSAGKSIQTPTVTKQLPTSDELKTLGIEKLTLRAISNIEDINKIGSLFAVCFIFLLVYIGITGKTFK